jgi:hypothetical protein
MDSLATSYKTDEVYSLGGVEITWVSLRYKDTDKIHKSTESPQPNEQITDGNQQNTEGQESGHMNQLIN